MRSWERIKHGLSPIDADQFFSRIPSMNNKQEQMREWKSRANAEYQKVIASIFSLSSAALVLPTLFLKDFVGLPAGVPLLTAVSCSVVVAWVLLFISIACCLVFYYASAKWLKLAYGGTVKWSEGAIERLLDIAFWAAGGTFMLGLGVLLHFMVNSVPKI